MTTPGTDPATNPPESSPQAVPVENGPDVGHVAPAAPSTSTTPSSDAGGVIASPATVTLVLAAPSYVHAFDPRIDGVAPITREGVEVGSTEVEAIEQAAAVSGITLDRR